MESAIDFVATDDLDPAPAAEGRPSGRFSSKSENPTGTPNQDIQPLTLYQRETATVTLSAPPAAVAAAQAALANRRRVVETGLLRNEVG
jgi:hypothetical protein